MKSFGGYRWAVFISGRGSTLRRLLENRHLVPIQLVVSSKPSVAGLQRAKRLGIPVHVMEDWQHLQKLLQEYQIERIFLAGFMRILPPEFVQCWEGRILNIHPSLLPKFGGLKSIERNYAASEDMGVTIHEVIEAVDAGRHRVQKLAWHADELKKIDYAAAEFFLHVCEQQALDRVVQKWI